MLFWVAGGIFLIFLAALGVVMYVVYCDPLCTCAMTRNQAYTLACLGVPRKQTTAC